MPHPKFTAAEAVNEALLVTANIDRLQVVLADFASALIKQAQQKYTAKTDGLLARFQAEHEALILIEEIFRIDTSDDCEAIADECLAECGYDLRKRSYPAEDAADFADYLYDFARGGVMIAQWERGQ